MQAEIEQLRAIVERLEKSHNVLMDENCEHITEIERMVAELERLRDGLIKLYTAIGQASVVDGYAQAVIVAMDGCYELIDESEDDNV